MPCVSPGVEREKRRKKKKRKRAKFVPEYFRKLFPDRPFYAIQNLLGNGKTLTRAPPNQPGSAASWVLGPADKLGGRKCGTRQIGTQFCFSFLVHGAEDWTGLDWTAPFLNEKRGEGK